MLRTHRIFVTALLLALIGALAAFVIISVNAYRLSNEIAFTNLEIDRLYTLKAGGVVVPLHTQTPGIFEPTLTAIAELMTHKPVLRDFGDMPMVEVPAGCFYMGAIFYAGIQPTSQQCFDTPFWISQTAVTNAQYKAFVESGDYLTVRYWTNDGWAWRKAATVKDDHTRPYLWDDPHYNAPDQPVIGATWHEALAFTKWLTEHYRTNGIIGVDEVIRLPSEAEWEYAARGPNSLIYPWGNDWDASKSFIRRYVKTPVAPVGSVPSGASWVGALDISGNEPEWTNTLYIYDKFVYAYVADDGRENINASGPRIVRDNIWDYVDPTGRPIYLEAVHRNYADPSDRGYGFRIVIASAHP